MVILMCLGSFMLITVRTNAQLANYLQNYSRPQHVQSGIAIQLAFGSIKMGFQCSLQTTHILITKNAVEIWECYTTL